MINFENTENAFRYKSNSELNSSFFLFRVLSRNWLVSIVNNFFKAGLALHFPLDWIVKPTVYKQFVGGVNITECEPAVRKLQKFGVKAILDYSIEGGSSLEEINATLAETLRSIDNAGKDPNIPFAVFKPSGFCDVNTLEILSQQENPPAAAMAEGENFRQRVNILCQAAFDAGVPILIDAEDSWYQKFIDQVVDEMMAKYNKERVIVFNTFQMYRHDRTVFLGVTLEKARQGNYYAGLKFVRGAYMEKERARALKMGYPSPIHKDKDATDNAYNEALLLALKNIDRVMVFNGSHNEDSNRIQADFILQSELDKNDARIWFSQLYGMSDHISFNLAAEGFNVAKYVPYGPVRHVMPYLFRRAEENTSIAGQTGRELRLLGIEKARRRKKA
ncbi:MAG: proline dehydrogenase family protein [Bacteroidota bacterium]